ncbi:SDR family oxidoreductase [Neolewinella antarctica]|uniref:NAD(P)-dependent dehydrogenase (Short-subunit alcohol dehydrogenase family) n=1 Tax=Neolewinella antarctica TaxID=442734 RepID=A0ABX0XFA4_9BACT|nr:SDR family oxidoreductase [Neolewinella antarctica]NJC27561.1 NAD(P)-dependent dehydrogenase (short-subunit alcohol dehydrogenase family) [Neolewinella antarctica]
MKDKTILITGANDGIGRATAEQLAGRGAHLVLACRDDTKGQRVAKEIMETTGNHNVDTLPLDLADFASVKAASEEFLAEHPKLDVLINNAGVYTDRLELTTDGYELQFGVNHLGHFLLTLNLLPAIQCCRHCTRVINVASAIHKKGVLDFTNLRGEKKSYNGTEAYAQSKLANVLFTMELDRRYGQDMTTNCLHPGLVGTRLANKKAGALTSAVWSMYKPFATRPEQGAATSVYLATNPEVRDVSGRYFDERQCLQKPSAIARNEQLARRLWEYSEQAVADFRL